MIKIYEEALNAAKKYTVMDFACLKISLLAAGILLGVYYAAYIKRYIAVIWAIFISAFIWIKFRTIRYMMD